MIARQEPHPHLPYRRRPRRPRPRQFHRAAHRRGGACRRRRGVRETAASAVADFGIDRSFADADDALDWGAFDAVVITTPTFTHRDFAVAAANAGKHVFLEKPMALTLAECDAIIDAAKRPASCCRSASCAASTRISARRRSASTRARSAGR